MSEIGAPLNLARALAHIALVLALVLLASCADGPELPAPGQDALDQCGGQCSNVQLCVQDAEGVFGCAMICANQFHCWSGCCQRLENTGYNVCRPTNVCYGP
jgi:hypothetical protein